MDIKKLEEHQATLRGLRDTAGAVRGDPNATTAMVASAALVCLEALAGVVNDLIDERLENSKHTADVAGMMAEGKQ
jgi:hypothetical protein